MRLLLDEVAHGVVALPSAFFLWYKTGLFESFFVVMLVTYLVDLDHLVDYFTYYGFSFNLRDFLSGDYFRLSKRAIEPLHAWEWIILLGLILFLRGWNSLLITTLLFGFLPHLLYDAYSLRSLRFYSVIYRAMNGFRYRPREV